jgi:diguanylate cyclase (GGDEF)-like protein
VLIATLEEDEAVVIRASAGAWAGVNWLRELPVEVGAAISACMRSGRVERAPGVALLLPMRHGGRTLGAIGVADTPAAAEIEDPLALFAGHVGVALENHRLHDMASVDSLSSVHSRRHVLERLLEWLQLSVRNRQPLSLLLIDMDNLKALNDRHGHVAGDRAIARFGECLRTTVRDTDVAGRYGGDEFLVLTPQTSPAGAAVLAERLRAKLAALEPAGSAERTRLSATVAYGGLEPALLGSWLAGRVPKATWNELSRLFISAIDEALYGAKQAGRNRVAAAGTDGWVTEQVAAGAVELGRGISAAPERTGR